MSALAESSNVVNTCFLLLDKKGWRCWYNESLDMFGAEKDGWDFLANSPAGLVGLVAIYEHCNPTEFREYWWRADGPEDHYTTIPNAKPEFIPVSQCR
jgi:hypothetical protein